MKILSKNFVSTPWIINIPLGNSMVHHICVIQIDLGQ